MKILLSLIAIAMFADVSFAKSYKIATFPIPLMVESKDKGVFVELTKAVAKKAGVDIEIVVAPPKRTVGGFIEKKSAGFFPALDVAVPGAVAKSDPIYMKRDFIFTTEKNKISKVGGLEGKNVGITRGYPYAKSVTSNKKIKFKEADNDVANIKKLTSGRIDAFIVEEKTGLKAIEKARGKGVWYDKENPISEQSVYYAFQDSAEGKELAQKFSKALSALKADGTFGKIMSKAN